jgi:PAS domain S-box-containing protein
MDELQFSDIFDLDDIQRIQDLFSDATGVASLITFPDGRPITRPSNFCRFCNEIIRKTDLGLSNCFKSDSEIGKPNPDGPVIKQCLSGGLWDAGASIIVGGKHIANWLIGQVRNDELDSQKMLEYAKKIGSDQNDFMKALGEVQVMSKDKFTKVAQMLYAFANEISSKAYNNKLLIKSIKELKEAEEKLVKSELLNSTLIKHLPQRIFVKDPESRYILCNDIYSRDLGIDPKDIVGKNDFDFFQKELAEKYRGDDQKVVSEGIQKEDEEKYSIANQQRWTHVIKVPYRDSNDRIIGVLGIFEDITERKLRQEEIILKNDLLQTMNAEKDKFFSIIAHDLRSPLSAFVSTTQMLSEEIQSMNIEEIKKVTMNLSASATNIYSLLENLLEWSMLRRDGLDFVPEKLNLARKVKQCIDILSESARKKEIRIGISIPEDIDIFADKHMFDTILRNLVSNAIKFSPQGARVIISALSNDKDLIEVKVEDTGIGMSSEILGKLFVLDQQTSRKGTNGEPSTGLGLLLCKEFIEKNGGKISVRSEVGKGSIFSFTVMQFHNKVI